MFLQEAKKIIRLFKGYKGLSPHRIPPYRVNDLTVIARKHKPKLVKISKLKWILATPIPKENLEFRAPDNAPILIARIDNKLTVIDGINRLKSAIEHGKDHIMAIRLSRSEIKPFAKFRRTEIKDYKDFYKKDDKDA